MKLLDKRTTGDLVRLTIFVVITTLCTGLLVLVIGNISFGSTKDYKAEFVDATGVNKGDDVRIAGVKVGTVKNVQIVNRTHALLTFSVASDESLDKATHATIKYRNLVGQRYLALTDEIGDGSRLQPGSTIPVAQTTPALDLSVLFNGFKPLFQALSPNDINALSYEIVQVFQGEGGTLDDLLGHTASLTQTLADRDQVIDSLIDNLNDVLVHVGSRDQELTQLITTYKSFVHGLDQDKQPILDSLDSISGLSQQTADLVSGIRAPFVEDIKQLRIFAGQVASQRQGLDADLQMEAQKLNKIGATATYGSWFNFYLCGFGGSATLPGGVRVPLGMKVTSARCNLG
ncbi:MAG: MCE family protein [Nocardioidaceae bacterium]|uniref:MCE family protein n=1 Tax=Nocardioides nematodiphilus TaxID=2849669 RepID=UPI001CDA1AB3|nr:MlaD family protein [Nocardioides nematodiphilus]MCA1984319.1 MCE family protein [Nocardioides nematodiphilus]